MSRISPPWPSEQTSVVSVVSVVKKRPGRDSRECRGGLTTEDAEEAGRATEAIVDTPHPGPFQLGPRGGWR